MKEFNQPIKDMLVGGLRPDDRMSINSGFLSQCVNARVSQYRDIADLSLFTPVSDPFAAGYLTGQSISIAHPFPQIFRTASGTYLLTATGLYTVTEGANWTLSRVTTYDGRDIETAKSITGSATWHMADFGKNYVFFNGTSLVFANSAQEMFGGSAPALVINDFTAKTGCAFRGRLIMGGFSTSNFWNAEWDVILRSLYDNGLGLAFPTAPGGNYVWWSDIGEGGMFLLYPSPELYGLIYDDGEAAFDAAQNKLFETVEKNLMGFMPMPWQGDVIHTQGLGNGVMVYGDDGIVYMPSVQGTFGVNPIMSIGLANRSAVGVNDRMNPTEHVFIDKAGCLYRIDAGQNWKNLGFREFFEDSVDEDITISYDPVEREYHICDGDYNYILTDQDKLYESTFLVNSTAHKNGTTYGVYDRPGEDEDDYVYVVSLPLDFNIRGVNLIERVVVTSVNTGTLAVAIDWRMKTSDSWKRTPYKVVNYEGAAYFPIRGIEFRIAIRNTDYTTLDIDDVNVHFKTTDRRLLKGTYALNRGQYGNS